LGQGYAPLFALRCNQRTMATHFLRLQM